MTTLDARKAIQGILKVTQDGDIGPITIAALNKATAEQIKAIQVELFVAEDGEFGRLSNEALTHLESLPVSSSWPVIDPNPVIPNDQGWHIVKASTFADPADVTAFQRCKARGGSDLSCFSVGDNGIGKWGRSCIKGTGPKCALPPEVWAPFGSTANHKPVWVRLPGGESVLCYLDDTMPHVKLITNGCRIDTNYDLAKALGHTPPDTFQVEWKWA